MTVLPILSGCVGCGDHLVLDAETRETANVDALMFLNLNLMRRSMFY